MKKIVENIDFIFEYLPNLIALALRDPFTALCAFLIVVECAFYDPSSE